MVETVNNEHKGDDLIELQDGHLVSLVGVTAGGDSSKLALYAIDGDETYPVWFNEYESVFEGCETIDDPYSVDEIYGYDETEWEQAADSKLERLGLKLGEWHKVLHVSKTTFHDCYDLVKA